LSVRRELQIHGLDELDQSRRDGPILIHQVTRAKVAQSGKLPTINQRDVNEDEYEFPLTKENK
jgi:hypothetical protein